MMLRTRSLLANMLWLGACLPDRAAFQRAAGDVRRSQGRTLWRILQENADTEYGRRYGFAGLRSIREFQRRVPLTSYEDYRAEIERIGRGRENVLTHEPVRLFEPTGGSSGGTKLIPYTDQLKAEFQRGAGSWIAELLLNHRDVWPGQAYWSVTPVTWRTRYTEAGIPIGFEEDTEYLSRMQQLLVGSILAVPPAVKQISDLESFRYVTLLFLLRSCSLSLISVWNPTFLTLLIEQLDGWWPGLVVDVRDGTITPPVALAPDICRDLQSRARPDPRRARELEGIFSAALSRGERHRRIWPSLRLVSCWADGPAKQDTEVLARWLPQATIQPKGLLATEGIVSFPLSGHPGGALAIRSHFFEFLPGGNNAARALLAHEIKPGERYSVVITTGGGLYRYQLQDIVEVVGSYQNCPLIEFVGKEDRISDRFGEKLHEHHVAKALAAAFERLQIQPEFSLLSCERFPEGHAYTLYLSADRCADGVLSELARDLDERLGENIHYRYCRDLGQLRALRLIPLGPECRDRYLRGCVERGQRLGDVKPAVLDPNGGWLETLAGRPSERATIAW